MRYVVTVKLMRLMDMLKSFARAGMTGKYILEDVALSEGLDQPAAEGSLVAAHLKKPA